MDKYHEKELGKLHPDVKKVKLSKKGQDHFDGKHDYDYIDPKEKPVIAGVNAKLKAMAMINWAELSRNLAGDRSSITKDRIPKKHQPVINELIDNIAKWYLDNQLGDSPKAGGAI